MTRKQYATPKGGRVLYIIAAYIVAIVFFTLFRIANTIVFCSAQHPDLEGLYYKSLIMGFRFDSLIACFVLALPLLMAIVGELTHIRAKAYYAVAHYFTVTLFIVCFFGCAADIPYFNYFFARLNAQAVNWGDDAGIILSMIFTEPSYVAYFLVFLAVAIGYWFIMRWLYRRLMRPAPDTQWLSYGIAIPLSVVLILLCLLAMRGRIALKRPMGVGVAYFSNNPFLNQIGLNPIYTLFKSLEDQSKSKNAPVALMDEEKARLFIEQLKEQTSQQLRPTDCDTIALPEGINVVLVLMESMSADKVGFFNPESDLTPNLDSLINRSLIFTNAYSAGIHTHNGIYSTLCSHPALLERNALKQTNIPSMCGLPHAFLHNGYKTMFFVPHDSEYDNMNGFLMSNAVEHFFTQKDYDQSLVGGTWGVPDHVMFDFAIETLKESDASQPFFACLLTCSDHGPYYYPDYIDLQPKHKEMHKKMTEYADWSIGRFMRKAAQQPWFENTLFVFVADHGANLKSLYDMPLSYHHEPLFFYYPGHIEPHRIDRPAMQIDLGPTMLGMLPIAWSNNTFGIDLLRHERPYAVFSADDKIGVIDNEWFYIYHVADQRESLYRYNEGDTRNHINDQRDRADEMRRYAFAMIQHSQTMLLNNETHCK